MHLSLLFLLADGTALGTDQSFSVKYCPRLYSLILLTIQQALAIMAQPSHVPSSLYELFLLSDEIWHLAGDTSVDSSWYTKRASLSAIYASTELFMTTDTSREFLQTERFLDRRLEGLQVIGQNLGSVSQWLDFSTRAANNVLRSKGIRL